jgi:hypothetical protein
MKRIIHLDVYEFNQDIKYFIVFWPLLCNCRSGANRSMSTEL